MAEKHSISFCARDLGLDHLGQTSVEELYHSITNGDHKLNEIVWALIKDTVMPGGVDHVPNLDLHIESMSNKVCFVLGNVPQGVLSEPDEKGSLTLPPGVESKILQSLRDVVVPTEADPSDPLACAKALVERSGILEKEWRPRTFVWGGHHVSSEAYLHTKQVGYADYDLNRTEYITGSGPDVMAAPFAGYIEAAQKYRQNGAIHLSDRDCIGFTEEGILAKEHPNEFVNKLLTFPDIYQRMVAFILSASRGRLHEGGVGTMQELFTALTVFLREENKDIPYKLDFVGMPNSEYVKGIQQYLQTVFKTSDRVDSILKFHLDANPNKFAEYVQETNKELPKTSLWQNNIHMPQAVLYPQERIGFESIESIDLSRNQSEAELMKQIELVFDSVVELSVRDQGIINTWGSDRPVIRGDKDILVATANMISKFQLESRIPAISGIDNQQLIRFETI